MFCKYCGKEIDFDSKFCHFCGAKLDSNIQDDSSEKQTETIYARFKALPKYTQICIIIYIVWVLFLILVLLHDSPKDWLLHIYIWVIGIPCLIVCIRYCIKLFKRDKKSKDTKVSLVNIPAPPNVSYSEPVLLETIPLITFAKSNGKMQIHKSYDKNLCKYISYCTFINDKNMCITVAFSKAIGELSKEDIMERKESLYIKKYSNGLFELDM